jgi:tetraacyldisaccharide 4'-kinase
MHPLRFLLLPFAAIYGFFMWMRNKFFDWGLLRSFVPPVASIGIGNLSVGGTGKSPIAAFIAGFFSESRNVVFISRGYGRKTRGYRVAGPEDTPATIGDEPYQIKNTLQGIKVVVDSNRVRAVKKSLAEFPETNLIIFDDIFQHRRIRPGLSIMLTDYSRPFFKDYILPAGRLRESRSGKKRADIIIVTKTPAIFSPIERRHLLQEIAPSARQEVLFSFLRYTGLIAFGASHENVTQVNKLFNKQTFVFAFCGIGNPGPFEDFIRENSSGYHLVKYRDHHEYATHDIHFLKSTFQSIRSTNKIIITTEKDMVKLRASALSELIDDLPLFALRINPAFHAPDDKNFERLLNEYVGKT